MGEDRSADGNRRDFLTGKALRRQAEQAGEAFADELAEGERVIPTGGPTVRLSVRAMACEFTIIRDPGPARETMLCSDALDLLHPLEAQISVYRDESELSLLNQRARTEPVEVEPELFDLLLECRRLFEETDGAFDATSGALISLWREARAEKTIPTQQQIDEAKRKTGTDKVRFDVENRTIRFDVDGLEFNLGAIGKGYALDRSATFLKDEGLQKFLYHGGHSSLLAAGAHQGQAGWPVGIRNPAFTDRRLATILLKDRALSSSGSNVQNFRHDGRRFGHILDPRTGWPAEGLLSATVLAPTAALADALSTAFFVLGVENAQRYCDNHPDVSAVLIPPPTRGRRLEPVVRGVHDELLFFTPEDSPPEPR